MSIDAKRRLASAAFVVLLILSVFWPAPSAPLNQLCCHASLPIDNLSFLGREAPAWDVVFWCLAGLVVIAILRSAPFAWRDFGAVRSAWKPAPRRPLVIVLVLLGAALGIALATAAIWRYADPPITAFAEGIQSGASENVIRLANRFGGGMKPALVIPFYLVAGVVYPGRHWVP